MTRIGPILYCGDPHGQFSHIIKAAGMTKASAVVLLGDLQPQEPLHLALAPLVELGVSIHFIHGNHDADSDDDWVLATVHIRAYLTVRTRFSVLPACGGGPSQLGVSPRAEP